MKVQQYMTNNFPIRNIFNDGNYVLIPFKEKCTLNYMPISLIYLLSRILERSFRRGEGLSHYVYLK